MRILIVDDAPGWVRHHTLNIKYLVDADIVTANSAKEADDFLLGNIDTPFDIIFTDMQMESDFLPIYAGEWLIRQIQTYPQYKNTKIVIISATPEIAKIAEKYHTDYIPKRKCQTLTEYQRILVD